MTTQLPFEPHTRVLQPSEAHFPRVAPITFLDLKTTGPDPALHEIIEIGLVRVDGQTLSPIGELGILVAPEHLETAQADALTDVGFSRPGWFKASALRQALAAVSAWLDGSFVGGHHVSFDVAFLDAAARRLGLPTLGPDYPRIDTVSLVWPLYAAGEISSFGLQDVASYLGLDRARPYRALADARCSVAIARCMRERVLAGQRLASMAGDERAILDVLIERISMGRKQYGPWHVHDKRDYRHEALLEVLDALNYIAAELVRRGKNAASEVAS